MSKVPSILRNQIEKLLAQALADETLKSIYGERIPKNVKQEEIKRISRDRANQMIQDLEESIQVNVTSSILNEYIKSTDKKFSDLHQIIMKRTAFIANVQVNTFSTFLYSILLVLFLVIGNYTFPGLGKSISNQQINGLSYLLIHPPYGRIYGLDLGKDHRNPDGKQVGEKHKHRWNEAFRDKQAYVPPDITATFNEPVKVWQQFCQEAKIIIMVSCTSHWIFNLICLYDVASLPRN